MTAIILAGGKASRFGSDKAFMQLDGVPLIKRQLKLLKIIFNKIIIVTNNPHESRSFYKMAHSLDNKGEDKYKLRKIKVIQDIIPNRGPLGGIYSGLSASESRYNFVVACDMPFLNVSLIRYLIKNKGKFEVIVPKIDKEYHPLFGIYSRNSIPVIKKLLDQNKLKVSSLFSRVKAHFISYREIKKFDPSFLSLANINTREDYRVYKKADAL